jgi:hypothetical protein
MMEDLDKTIQLAISSRKRIRIQAYSVSDTIEKRVQDILRLILSSYGREDLVSGIYTCLKELLINAVKANFKNLYFEDYSFENNPEINLDYETALKLFKLEISRENATHLARIARTKNLSAEIIFSITPEDELFISVENPIEMTELEKETVSRKLRDARKCDDISEYFLQVEDDPNTEGAGIGLVLIALMLRNLGVPEDKFVISSENNITYAYFSVPLQSEIKVP